jgi:hypothetical protein
VDLHLGSRFTRGGDHRGRRVDGDDVVAAFGEVAGEPPLAAPEVEGPRRRRRQKLEEEVAVVADVVPVELCRVVRPADPVGRVPLPGRPQVTRLKSPPRHRLRP